MIALEELRKVRKSLMSERSAISKNLHSTESYASRQRSRLKDVDERLRRIDKEMVELQGPKRKGGT